MGFFGALFTPALLCGAVVCLAVLCAVLWTKPVAAGQHTQIATVNDYTYEIEVGGLRDPVNETIIIENLGDAPVINPRITVNGYGDWFDVAAMAQAATRGCTTDEERALGIWDFVRRNFHHLASPGDRECHNPVVALNVYGYANCAYHSSAFVALCRAVGIPARVWEVWHHTVSEAFYNNAWHMLDSDIGLYYLGEDNRTIASVEQLWADQRVTQGLESRAHLTAFSGRNKAMPAVYTDVTGHNAYVSQDGKKIRGYRYYHGADECYVQEEYDRFTYEPHTMGMVLRPGEKLIRNWKGGDKFFDYVRHKRSYEAGNKEAVPIRYGDGQVIWKPDLVSLYAPTFLNRNQPPAFMVEDGIFPPVHVRYKNGGIYDLPTRAILKTETPYVILGGNLKAKLYRGAATEWDQVSITVSSRTGPVNRVIWRAPEGATGSLNADIDLDEVLFPGGARGRHDYMLEFNFMANERNRPPSQSGLVSVEMTADIQCASNALPALSLGRNIVRYRDETPGPHRVQITHLWRERIDVHSPAPPAEAVYPLDGKTTKDLNPEFCWRPAQNKAGPEKAIDYCVMVSLDPQCRWPLATALQHETGSHAPTWRIDAGWLNPDTVYYWRVKAKNSSGIWGDWGPVFHFRTGPR